LPHQRPTQGIGFRTSWRSFFVLRKFDARALVLRLALAQGTNRSPRGAAFDAFSSGIQKGTVRITEGKRTLASTEHTQVGRNEKCPCGSGRKYKQCCLRKDEEEARVAREKAAAKEAREAEKARKAAEKAGETSDKDATASGASVQQKPRQNQTHQPWKKSATNTHAFQRVSTPRKVGGS
jgi:hypothetical protein